MDHPVFIAVLAGLVVAALLVALRERNTKKRPPAHSPFEEER